jgi:hypothetical protein
MKSKIKHQHNPAGQGKNRKQPIRLKSDCQPVNERLPNETREQYVARRKQSQQYIAKYHTNRII